LLEAAFAMYSDMLADPMIVVKSEYQLWRREWEQQPAGNRPKSALAALDYCNMYPNISKLLQLVATLPITTAEAEFFLKNGADIDCHLCLSGGGTI
jgi:hypothetical protein